MLGRGNKEDKVENYLPFLIEYFISKQKIALCLPIFLITNLKKTYMKKVILIGAIVFLSTHLNAQISFGVQVGGNLANVKISDTESGTTTKQNTKVKFGFLVGVVAEIPIASSLSFRPELNFIQKGFKVDQTLSESGATIVSTGNETSNFIEVPLNVVYNLSVGNGKVFFGIGPSIGYGISGKFSSLTTTTFPGEPTEIQSDNGNVKFDGKKAADISSGDKDTHLKALDFGGNILAGYKMSNGLYLNAGYTLGFSNLNPNAKTSFKTNGLTIKVGFMFGGNKDN